MNILIAGATGLIGKDLVCHLSVHHNISVLGRDACLLKKIFPSSQSYEWGFLRVDHLSDFDVIVNLAGENIGNGLWTKRKKNEIKKSRVNSTKLLADLCSELKGDAPRLFNASAVGVYGSSVAGKFDEMSEMPADPTSFLSEVSYAWEGALSSAVDAGVNVVVLRFGIVLSRNGGMLKQLIPSVKLGFGAVMGHGGQYLPWVALSDVVNAIDFLINNDAAQGPYNIVSNDEITQREFSKSLSRYLYRPCFIRAPSLIIKAIFGQMGDELLLKGSNVYPRRLQESGFKFEYNNLQDLWTKIL